MTNENNNLLTRKYMEYVKTTLEANKWRNKYINKYINKAMKDSFCVSFWLYENINFLFKRFFCPLLSCVLVTIDIMQAIQNKVHILGPCIPGIFRYTRIFTNHECFFFYRIGSNRLVKERQTRESLCAQSVNHSKLLLYPTSALTCAGKRHMTGMEIWNHQNVIMYAIFGVFQYFMCDSISDVKWGTVVLQEIHKKWVNVMFLCLEFSNVSV